MKNHFSHKGLFGSQTKCFMAICIIIIMYWKYNKTVLIIVISIQCHDINWSGHKIIY